ncbi:tetratricopeptide repeat protein [Nocardia sp. CS682]|uniref:ATP-binding protein n=1 Tax=Nocardia sp. CS682 TaxID=1047172 RepID=UPI0010751CD2|nr:tetratricopeptide repeat protein [Nocardia sp. CS682]QBS40719.1 hypothetical protein DMB37_11925 [Nocardia sp. CS682]
MTRFAELWEAAGNPTLARVAAATEERRKATRTPAQSHRSLMQRISDWRTGRNVPSRFESLDPVLVTLISLARQASGSVPAPLSNRSAWRHLWKAASTQPVRPTVLTSLRRDVPTFVGRDVEVQRILDAAGPGRVVAIHTVDGMPGVGKTALVTHAAHLLADSFPDGRFFVELNTHTPGQEPADPAEVLATLLTGLGIAPSHIPDSLDARRDLWRDRVAAKRVLLILDDARDHNQIEPLLPTGPDCLTLITSRRRLVALDSAVPLPLDTLDPDKAKDLFCRLAQRNPQGDDSAAVAEIVRLCGYLPLAIVLLAGRTAHHPVWTLAGLAEQFRAAQDRLGELDAGQRAVRAAFTASYESLPPGRQHLFRTLGLHPGTDFDAYAVAALNDIPLAEARTELDALYTDHLVEETTPGRYCLHDLVREYARALAASSGDDTAPVRRLLDYYLSTAAAADQWLTRKPYPTDYQHISGITGTALPEFGTEMHALAWLRMERTTLLACLEYTADRDPARMVGLTEVLAEFLEREGPWSSALRWHERAAAAADRLGDRLGRANALTNLATVQWQSGNYDRDADPLQQVLTLYRETGNRLGEAKTLRNLGMVQWQTGNYDLAADLLRQALILYRDTGYLLGEARTLASLGGVRRDNGDYEQAAQLFQQVLSLYRETGHRFGEASALGFLGTVRRYTRDYNHAADLLLRAATLFRELGDRVGEARALSCLGKVRRDTGDYRQATDLSRQALILFRETGNRIGEADALVNLSAVCRETGNHEQATDLSRQALALLRKTGYRVQEVEALNNTAKALLAAGEPGEALTMFTHALAVARDIDSRIQQASAMEGTVRCRAALGDTAHPRHAIDSYRRLGPSDRPTGRLLPDEITR